MAQCEIPGIIHTVGHSTRAIDAFIDALTAHAIEALVDVRRWPGSRRHPQFKRETLAASLKANGIEYSWRGDLGGFRKPSPDSANTAWRVSAFRAYADFMMTQAFGAAMEELERLAEEKAAAVMCAEFLPWRCHRQLLADAFLVRGWSVRHILEDRCEEHQLPPFAKPAGTTILYTAS